MSITSAQYNTHKDGTQNIIATINGVSVFVPIDLANRNYAEIKAKHDDPNDSFTIQDAD